MIEYGKSEAMKSLPDIMLLNKIHEMARVVAESNPKFFIISRSHRWWHWITRPIKTYKLMKYLKSVEVKVAEQFDMDKVSELYLESAVYGVAVMEVED